MKLLQTSQLGNWADTKAAEGEAPLWVRRMILASVNPRSLRMPWGDSTRHRGFDGVVANSQEHRFVPLGTSYWEIGVGADCKAKADKDYEKRSDPSKANSPSASEAADSTFVFVTPRVWSGKDAWIKERKADGLWKDIRVIDGDDWEAWLETVPPVALQMTASLGYAPPHGLQDADAAWEEWSRLTQPQTTERLALLGAAAIEIDIAAALRDPPCTIAVRSDSPRHAWGLSLACIRRLAASQEGEGLVARCIVAADEQVAAELPTLQNSVVVLKSTRGQVSGSLAARGCHVIIPEGNDGLSRYALGPPTRSTVSEFADALREMGLAAESAEREARACGRSVAILQRRLAAANALRPAWADGAAAYELLPAMLAGRWNNRSEHDRAVLCALARTSDYDAFERKLTRFLGLSEAPLQRIGDMWVATAPADLFELLANRLIATDLEVFEQQFRIVFATVDETLELSVEDWSAEMGTKRSHSSWLRAGMAETLLLIAERGGNARLPHSSPELLAERIVRGIPGLSDNWRVLASMRDQYARLMEAAPSPLLDGLERLLEAKSEDVALLFGDRESFFAGTPFHTGVLWGLETLAWDPKLLPRVSLILAGLAERDPGGRTVNRPINSLREIFLWWHPGTGASIEQRLDSVDLILSKSPAVAWSLLSMLIDAGPSVSHTTATPRWREFDQSSSTKDDRIRYVAGIVDRVLAQVGHDASRWEDVLGALSLMSGEQQDRVVELLSNIADQPSTSEREALWQVGRRFVNRQRSNPESRWAQSTDLVDRIDKAIAGLSSSDPVRRHRWLFEEWTPPIGIKYGAPEFEREVSQLRNQAVKEIWRTRGLDGVVELGTSAKMTGFASQAAISAAADRNEVLSLLKAAIAIGGDELHFASVLSASARSALGTSWTELLVAECKAGMWPVLTRAALLRFWPDEREGWKLAEELGTEVEAEYWRLRPYHLLEDAEEREFQIRHLIGAGRAIDLVHSLSSESHDVTGSLLLDVIDAAVLRMGAPQGPDEVKRSGISSYDLARFLERLRKDPALNREEIARREYQVLPLLGYTDSGDLTLHEMMAEDPQLFVQILSDVFRAAGSVEGPEPSEQARARAQAGYRLLSGMYRVPGFGGDTDPESALLEWVSSVRSRAAEIDRTAIADLKIGELLARAPADPVDGLWPHRAVRAAIEKFPSDELRRGVAIGKYNQRGVVSKSLYEGGTQERDLGRTYRDWAVGIRAKWPRTADLLDQIARTWEDEARQADTRAQQARASDS